MRLRIFTLVLALLCCCSGAWAQDATRTKVLVSASPVWTLVGGSSGSVTWETYNGSSKAVSSHYLTSTDKGYRAAYWYPCNLSLPSEQDLEVSFEFAFAKPNEGNECHFYLMSKSFNCGSNAKPTSGVILDFNLTSTTVNNVDFSQCVNSFSSTPSEIIQGKKYGGLKLTPVTVSIDNVKKIATVAFKQSDGNEKSVEVALGASVSSFAGFCDNLGRYYSALCLNNVSVTTIKYNIVKELTNYVVRSVDENGNVLKSVTKEGYVGDNPVVTEAEKSSFYGSNHSQAYYYLEDNASSTTIKSGGTTIVNVVFAKRTISSYTFVAENLSNRAPIAVPSSDGVLISWRSLIGDNAATVFDIYKNGATTPLVSNLRQTNYVDNTFSFGDTYVVKTKVNGSVIEETEVSSWSSQKKVLQMSRPSNSTMPDNTVCSYEPNDCSVADVDGDGEYEIIVKWYPSNAQDNSINGYTGRTYLDCYEFDGTQRWRIDLGQNIRSGAHYTQFLVYDFDGDGKAELMCKTAPGSKDGIGNYVNQAATNSTIKAASNTQSWLTSNGRVDGGQEYLTVFDGETGRAVHTIAYNPNRNANSNISDASGTFDWDDRASNHDYGSYGNRGERYLAAVASLGGASANPSAVFCRGYYSYAYVWAVDYVGKQLKPRWLHRSDSNTSYSVIDYQSNSSGVSKTYTPKASFAGVGRNTLFGNGNHNLSVGDVDNDGKDEIVFGSATLDHDGTLKYTTGFGHGDALHLADIDPSHPGLEVFAVHEDGNKNNPGETDFGWDLHDAETGNILQWSNGTADNGRGMAADVFADNYGLEFWSSKESRVLNASGTTLGTSKPSVNFRVYWDGDLQDNLLDGNVVTDWKGTFANTILTMSGSSSCNGTKATPCLQADIFGDWREEIILYDVNDPSKLNIYSTNIPTPYLVTTPMQDHVYRMGIAWQNVGYNQPPHLGYYLPDVASVKVTFNGSGYAMFSSKKNVTVAGMNGVSAYRGGNISGDYINMYKVTEIPAGEGALLKGTANSTVYLPVIYAADEIAGNTLVGAPDGASVQANANYVLASAPTDELSVLASSTVAAGSAYVVKGKNSASTLKFVLREGLAGDVNGDGILTIADVVLANKCLLGEITSSTFVTRSDWNGDGKVTRDDVDNIANAVMNQE